MSALSQKTMARVFPMCLTVVFGVSCRDKGSTSASEADVMTTLSSQSGSNIMLESALITDLNADDMSKRIEWIARQATAAGANNLPAVQNLDGSQSGCQTKEMGVIDEGGALPLPDGRVIYCSGGRLSYAQQDSESQQLLLKLGVTSSELSGVRFYRVPTSTPNAWATVTESNVAVVALYDGLAADARKYNLDPYSLVAVALAHEVGHIIDMKKSGFTNLRSAQKRIWDDCEFRAQKVDSQAALEAREEACARAFSATKRSYEYSADNFALEVLGRKKFVKELDPSTIAKWFDAKGRGSYNAYGSHPDGKERGLQFTRGLQRLGISP